MSEEDHVYADAYLALNDEERMEIWDDIGEVSGVEPLFMPEPLILAWIVRAMRARNEMLLAVLRAGSEAC